MRTFHLAHALAKSGHEIHVITNAKKVNAPQHIIMRDCDWQKCETQNSSGTVNVHWNDSAVTTDQLVSVGRSIAAQTNFDAIFSFYMEPYAVVGHLLSQALNLPHIIKTAGSDIGRLWEQAQFKDQFNQAFLAASMIITGGTTAQ
ncbi:MAG: glycosyltransferase, partial [Rhodospirillales bacterium]